jgi:hypothetical protein
LVRALSDIGDTSVIWTLDGLHTHAEDFLRTIFLLLDTDGVSGGGVESTFDRQVDTAAIGEGLFSVLLFTGKVILGALTVLVALLRSVVRAPIGSSAHGLILDTHAALTSVVELRWAGVGNWTVFGIDSARAVITSIEVLFALVEWSALFG